MNTDTLTIISAFGSSAAGAILGALSAYRLGIRNEKIKKRNEDHGGLLKAQYALMSQWNIIKGLQKDLLDPRRDDPLRHFRMPKFYTSGKPLRVSFEQISFIAQSENPNLLQEIHIAEQNYDTVIETLNQLVESLDRLQTNSNILGQNFDIESGAARIAADPRDMFYVKKWTDTLYEVADKAVVILNKEIKSIEHFSKENFKGMKSLKLVTKESKGKKEKKEDFAENYSILKWIKQLWRHNQSR